MKKKIILLVFCAVLFLIFASSSFGDIDPRYKLRGHPEQELKSPPVQDQRNDMVLLIIPTLKSFFLVVCAKSDSPKENPALRSLISQELESKNNVKRAR